MTTAVYSFHSRSVRATRSVLLQFSGFIMGRATGFLRDVIIAGAFGASSLVDAYQLALVIPITVNNLIAGGTLQAAIMPALSRNRAAGLTHEFWDLVYTLANLTLFATVLLSVVVGVFAQDIVNLIWSGISNETALASARLVQIAMVLLVVNGLLSLAIAVLSAAHDFRSSSYISPALNLTIILFVVLAGPSLGIMALVAGVVTGTVLQLVIQILPLVRLGFRYKLTVNWRHKDLRASWMLFVPLVLSSVVANVNWVIDRFLGTFLPAGSIAAIAYAETIVSVLYMASMPLANVVFPMLTELVAKGEYGAAAKYFTWASRVAAFWVLPGSLVLAMFSTTIVEVIYQRGRFDLVATETTALALRSYAIGAGGFALFGIAIKAFYALSDTRTPLYIGVVTMILHYALAVALIPGFGLGGLTVAASISWITNFLVAILLLRTRLGLRIAHDLGASFARTLFCCVPLVSVAVLDRLAFGSSPPGSHLVRQFGEIATGLALFLVLARIIRAEELYASIEFAWRAIGRGERPSNVLSE